MRRTSFLAFESGFAHFVHMQKILEKERLGKHV